MGVTPDGNSLAVTWVGWGLDIEILGGRGSGCLGVLDVRIMGGGVSRFEYLSLSGVSSGEHSRAASLFS